MTVQNLYNILDTLGKDKILHFAVFFSICLTFSKALEIKNLQ